MSPLTRRLARLGAHGRYPNNIERDLFRVLELPVPVHHVEIPVKDAATRSNIVVMRAPILLPHEIYHYLFEACFRAVFGDRCWSPVA